MARPTKTVIRIANGRGEYAHFTGLIYGSARREVLDYCVLEAFKLLYGDGYAVELRDAHRLKTVRGVEREVVIGNWRELAHEAR